MRSRSKILLTSCLILVSVVPFFTPRTWRVNIPSPLLQPKQLSNLRILLFTQGVLSSRSKSNVVHGSERTTYGLMKALEESVSVSYVARLDSSSDVTPGLNISLVIVEGFDVNVAHKLSRVRQFYPRATVLYILWCVHRSQLRGIHVF